MGLLASKFTRLLSALTLNKRSLKILSSATQITILITRTLQTQKRGFSLFRNRGHTSLFFKYSAQTTRRLEAIMQLFNYVSMESLNQHLMPAQTKAISFIFPPFYTLIEVIESSFSYLEVLSSHNTKLHNTSPIFLVFNLARYCVFSCVNLIFVS